jgi:tetratricopeptide (TPR) repeat protein
MTETGNKLALMNLTEAEHALYRGDRTKAEEHLHLAVELAEDVAIREMAEKLMAPPLPPVSSQETKSGHHNCISCAGGHAKPAENESVPDDDLDAEDRFELLIQTLPDTLPGRYAALGKKFAYGYLLTHEGDDAAALQIFEELLAEGENDILLYEIATIHFRSGRLAECEGFLRRAMELNGENALCHLGLVQLLTHTGRVAETIPLLTHMTEFGLMPEQAMVFLGEAYLALGKEDKGMESYLKALAAPKVAREAAEKLIPLLEKHGRQEEAAYIFKQFLKGCC